MKLGSSGGDWVSVPAAAQIENSPNRLKAVGFPLAPLIEAVMEIRFDGGLSAAEALAVVKPLSKFYSSTVESKQRAFSYDATAEAVTVEEARINYRLEGEDDTEVILIRPDGFAVCQLAPYRSWTVLFERLERDWEAIEKVVGPRQAARIAVRYINRIDVPVEGGQAQHEQYFAAYIQLPSAVASMTDFYFRFSIDVPEIEAVALIQSAVMPAAVEGKASFALDIDLFRSEGLGRDRAELLNQLNDFRGAKNRLYRLFLTEKALEEFK